MKLTEVDCLEEVKLTGQSDDEVDCLEEYVKLTRQSDDCLEMQGDGQRRLSQRLRHLLL